MILIHSETSSSQTGKPNSDTIRCFGITELQYIAGTIIEGRACDTLLATSKLKLAYRDTIIKEKDSQINKYSSESLLKDKLLLKKDTTITNLTKNFKKSQSQQKWLKLGWSSTTVVLGFTILYLVFTH